MKKYSHQDVTKAIKKFLKEGGEIERTEVEDGPDFKQQVQQADIRINQNRGIKVDPTFFANKPGWRAH